LPGPWSREFLSPDATKGHDGRQESYPRCDLGPMKSGPGGPRESAIPHDDLTREGPDGLGPKQAHPTGCDVARSPLGGSSVEVAFTRRPSALGLLAVGQGYGGVGPPCQRAPGKRLRRRRPALPACSWQRLASSWCACLGPRAGPPGQSLPQRPLLEARLDRGALHAREAWLPCVSPMLPVPPRTARACRCKPGASFGTELPMSGLIKSPDSIAPPTRRLQSAPVRMTTTSLGFAPLKRRQSAPARIPCRCASASPP